MKAPAKNTSVNANKVNDKTQPSSKLFTGAVVCMPSSTQQSWGMNINMMWFPLITPFTDFPVVKCWQKKCSSLCGRVGLAGVHAASPAGLEPAPVSQLLCDQRGVKSRRVRGAPPTTGGPESPTPTVSKKTWISSPMRWRISLSLATLLGSSGQMSGWADMWAGGLV